VTTASIKKAVRGPAGMFSCLPDGPNFALFFLLELFAIVGVEELFP
jgi:hypothetical protein